MILAAFGENGITAFKRNLGNTGIMNIYRGNSDDGAEIYIYKEDFEKAKEILVVMGFEEE